MMPVWGWILCCIGAFCFGWTLGADWLEDGGPFFGRWRGKPKPKEGDDTSKPEVHFGPYRDYYVDPKHGDDEEGDGTQEKPFRSTGRLQKEFIGRPKPNRFCGLTGCELKRPHSHTEDLIRRIRNK